MAREAPDPARSTVVAQYQARFAEHLDLLPNCVPIDMEMFLPGEKNTDRIVILYTPSGRSKDHWANKGVDETLEILHRVQEKYLEEVEVIFLEQVSYETVMKARQKAHIVIDECMTGSYHSTTLEGMSCGCISICWLDDTTRKTLQRLLADQSGAYDACQFRLLRLMSWSRDCVNMLRTVSALLS